MTRPLKAPPPPSGRCRSGVYAKGARRRYPRPGGRRRWPCRQRRSRIQASRGVLHGGGRRRGARLTVRTLNGTSTAAGRPGGGAATGASKPWRSRRSRSGNGSSPWHRARGRMRARPVRTASGAARALRGSVNARDTPGSSAGSAARKERSGCRDGRRGCRPLPRTDLRRTDPRAAVEAAGQAVCRSVRRPAATPTLQAAGMHDHVSATRWKYKAPEPGDPAGEPRSLPAAAMRRGRGHGQASRTGASCGRFTRLVPCPPGASCGQPSPGTAMVS